MNRKQAIAALRSGQELELVSRDATLTCFTRSAVWLDDDGDLVMSHPTRGVGTTLVLDCQLAGLALA